MKIEFITLLFCLLHNFHKNSQTLQCHQNPLSFFHKKLWIFIHYSPLFFPCFAKKENVKNIKDCR
jgi:hypothetical protein